MQRFTNVADNIICLDFDGVINSYKSGWNDGKLDDPPVVGAINWLRTLIQNFTVIIHSARLNDADQKANVKKWLGKHGLEVQYVNALKFEKKPIARWYIDDRAIRFDGTFPSPSSIKNTKPWIEKESS